MANRLAIGIVVWLVIITGGLGFYSFDLNRQVDRLNERVVSFQDEQSAFVTAVSDNVAALRVSTESGLSSLETKLAGARDDITAMKSDLAAVTDSIGAVSAQVTTLDERVAGAETGLNRLSSSIVDSATIYQKAVKATVRITNGQATAGSGFIYDTEGRVVTAYHVVKDLSPIYIMMFDGRVSSASLVGFCPYSDIAVLKIENNPSIEPLLLADSGNISIGEPVIAIGSPSDGDNPLGLRDTLTSGIISQINRFVDVDGLYIANLLQFDAAVNFGNSGCPLIDAKGKVIGVINARIDPAQGDGIYWAIASNKVKRVAEAIIATGSFAYPLIGIGISDLAPEQVKNIPLETANGAMVGSVTSGGAAHHSAGIQAGDIIISMDDVPMRNIADLTSYLGEFKSPGDTTVIEVIRGTGKLKITVTVGERTQ